MADTAPAEWSPVVGYPGYQVSRAGRLRTSPPEARPLTPRTVTGGYKAVSLTGPEGSKQMLVHRAVALSFVPNGEPASKIQVNHLDGDKSNNVATNLEWVTPAENVRHAQRTGLRNRTARKGRTVESIDADGTTALYPSVRDAARQVGLRSHKCINTAIQHPTRTAAGLRWRLVISEAPPNEEWRSVTACDGYQLTEIPYSVSSAGRVRNDRYDRPLIPTANGAGYMVVNLRTAGNKPRCFLVHRLVATVFCTVPAGETPGLDVDHLNRVRDDNRACNLQWMTRADHQRKTMGKAVVELRDGQRVNTFATVGDAAAAVDVQPLCITAVLKGRGRTCRGSTWAYLEDIEREQMDEYIDSVLSLF
jgi:hypothetical protein